MRAGYIDGRWIEGTGPRLIVQSPSTEREVAALQGLSIAEVEAAIASSRGAFDSGIWCSMPSGQRADILRKFIAALASRQSELEELIAHETGCPRYSGSMHSQVAGPLAIALDLIDLFLSLPDSEENHIPLKSRVMRGAAFLQSHRCYTPIGVVAGISAYNFPVMTALMKIIPALITGNTMVLRPSPLTPLSHLSFGDAAQEAGIPAGVLNVVLESAIDGAQLLTSHPDVDMVSFTGSADVGVRIMQQAAPTMKRLQLELGGKSAQIFLPDSVDGAAAAAMQVCTAHAGQGCALGTRIFVPETEKAAVLKRIEETMAVVRAGAIDDKDTRIGPVISAAQRARCEHFVAQAIAHGGRIVVGGKRPQNMEKGFYFEATVLDLPDNDNPAAQEEIFGPVVGIIGYRDVDHAIQMANASRFGLSAYVHGKDKSEALRVAMAIKSGTVNVNAGMASAYISSGGQRMSGIGRERGVDGLRAFQQHTNINLGG